MTHDWPALLATAIATVVVNVAIYAYGQGKLEQRVVILEQQRQELRAEWKEARTRIEKAITESKAPK